jgi:DNA-binding response OmpR family regulator
MTMPGQPLTGCRVLVVEDEYFIAIDLAAILTEHGAEVVGPVPTLDEAVEKILAGGFDVAVLDIGLVDGFSFAVSDELGRKGIPFMFVTGYSKAELPAALADVPFLQKPCGASELVSSIETLRLLLAAPENLRRSPVQMS